MENKIRVIIAFPNNEQREEFTDALDISFIGIDNDILYSGCQYQYTTEYINHKMIPFCVVYIDTETAMSRILDKKYKYLDVKLAANVWDFVVTGDHRLKEEDVENVYPCFILTSDRHIVI